MPHRYRPGCWLFVVVLLSSVGRPALASHEQEGQNVALALVGVAGGVGAAVGAVHVAWGGEWQKSAHAALLPTGVTCLAISIAFWRRGGQFDSRAEQYESANGSRAALEDAAKTARVGAGIFAATAVASAVGFLVLNTRALVANEASPPVASAPSLSISPAGVYLAGRF